jgi:hypothetical protein
MTSGETNLPAGPELDRLVAEKVMGWSLDDTMAGIPPYFDGVTMGYYTHEWEPSANIAHAMEVYLKLGHLAGDFRSGDGYAYLVYADSADHSTRKGCDPPYPVPDQADDDDKDYGCWSCHFHVGILGEGPEYPAGWEHGKCFCARADTAALAICRAALKAVCP